MEHLFVGELLRTLWLNRLYDVEIARPEVDNSGADLILVRGRIVRHIQLKSSGSTAKTARQTLNLDLLSKPSGCVVWNVFDEETLMFENFLWYGANPGDPLPDITSFPIALHTKGNAQGKKLERPNMRVIKKAQFTSIGTMADLLVSLIGS